MAGFLVKFPVFPNIETDFPMFFIIIIYNYHLTSLLPMPKILQCLENKANFFYLPCAFVPQKKLHLLFLLGGFSRKLFGKRQASLEAENRAMSS